MPKFFVKEKIDNKIVILGTDVNHIKNVLRKKVGDTILVSVISTIETFICEIDTISEDNIICSIKEKLEKQYESSIEITIFQGLPKAEKMELIIQKGTELGVKELVPVSMKRCIVKLDKKEESKKKERWQKIAEVAAKQCDRTIVPIIGDFYDIKSICKTIEEYDIVLLAYEKEEDNSIKREIESLKQMQKENLKIGVIIGPEGGLDEEEVKLLKENGAKVVTLGNRILRTETVAFTMTTILMYELGDLN